MARNIAKEACAPMSRRARAFAASQGWPQEESRSLRVTLDGDRWRVESESERAADLEYGTDEARPSAVLRQLGNRPEIVESAVLAVAERALKGAL